MNGHDVKRQKPTGRERRSLGDQAENFKIKFSISVFCMHDIIKKGQV
jgi:hypothetical protein